MTFFRLYAPDECGMDGYPYAWHRLPIDDRGMVAPGVKDIVREEAGNRCVRCQHPYRKGEHGSGEWSPCDEGCDHAGPQRVWNYEFEEWIHVERGPAFVTANRTVEARWRILTVHHLNGHKPDLRWWNLASLCQRCHLTIQGRVQLHRVWPWPHSEWFKPYAAGWYAHAYLGEDLDRAQTMERLDELLALELQVTA